MYRLIVHIGPPKTATTHIQKQLHASTQLLAEHGVYLPQSGRLEFEPAAACHHHLAWQYVQPALFSREQGGWQELAAELSGIDADTVVLSTEAFNTVICSSRYGQELRDELFKLSDDITIVYAARDQLSLINSYYNQAIKMLRPLASFEKFATNMVKSGQVDLVKNFESWYNSPKIKFKAVPFPEFQKNDAFVTFLRAAGINVPESDLPSRPGKSNVSLGPIGVEASRILARHIQKVFPDFSERDREILHRHSAAYARKAGWSEDKYWGWEPNLAEWAADQLSASNERFASAVWGGTWDVPMPTDQRSTDISLHELTGQQAAEIFEFVTAMTQRYYQHDRAR